MPPFLAFLIAIAVVSIVALLICLDMRNLRKLKKSWQQVAEELGIEFQGSENDMLVRHDDMELFTRANKRTVTNVICADTGDLRISLGDYRYVFSAWGSRNERRHDLTVCVLQDPKLALPVCRLRPERWLVDALGSLLGGQDIDFDDDDAFSRAYVLQGKNELEVRRLFSADLRAWFATRAKHGLHFECRGDSFLFHVHKLQHPREAKALMKDALEIRNLLKVQNDWSPIDEQGQLEDRSPIGVG